MSKTVILSTARTPFGKMGGGLSSLDATDLGGTAISEALDRADVQADEIQGVVYGQVLQAGQGQIPSRQAQIKAGIPKEVPSETVNKVCASGMRSIGIADQAIRAGDLEVGVTGGMESMSKAPYLLPGARFGFRMGDVQAIDAMTHDGLTNPFTEKQMINEASEVSNELEITRADMDRFAERSHQLAHKATEDGRLAEEVTDVSRHWRGDLVSFLLGCSFSFEEALMAEGLPIRHIEREVRVPMYRTNIQCQSAGPFAGPMVVSMRPFKPKDAIRAVQITTRFPAVHGAPVHLGHPHLIGISDIAKPDYGDPVPVGPDEIPVFWACGVTPQSVVATVKPEFCITHYPGSMLVTDKKNAELVLM